MRHNLIANCLDNRRNSRQRLEPRLRNVGGPDGSPHISDCVVERGRAFKSEMRNVIFLTLMFCDSPKVSSQQIAKKWISQKPFPPKERFEFKARRMKIFAEEELSTPNSFRRSDS